MSICLLELLITNIVFVEANSMWNLFKNQTKPMEASIPLITEEGTKFPTIPAPKKPASNWMAPAITTAAKKSERHQDPV
jgi:hypothetical protein